MHTAKFIGSAIMAAILAAGVGAASAADLKPRYAKAPVIVEPGWDWSGFYLGGNIGYGISRSPAYNNFVNTATPPVVSIGNSTPISADGVIGGGQIGYNMMASGFLFGVEADFQGADQKGQNYTNLSGFYGPGAFMAVQSRLNWFGTVRGRVGLASSPSTIVYATGGFAYGEVEVTNSAMIGGGFFTGGSSVKATKTGWTAGGGIETRLWNSNWTAKAEYLYLDLGSLGTSNINGIGGVHVSDVAFRDHIVRAGLNYKFNWAQPLVARY